MMIKRLIPIQTPINLGYFSQILVRPRASMKMQSPIMRYFAHFGQTKLNFHYVNKYFDFFKKLPFDFASEISMRVPQ